MEFEERKGRGCREEEEVGRGEEVEEEKRRRVEEEKRRRGVECGPGSGKENTN